MKIQLAKVPVVIFLSILLVFFYLLTIDRNPSKIPSNLLNKNVPYFETKNLIKDEIFISKKEFGKEVILVNFFATWCEPCRNEHRYIKNFATKKKLKIIGINYKDNPNKTKKWLEELGNPYSDIPLDKKGEIAIDWGVYGIPETFIVNSKGIIKYRHVGPVTEKIYKEIDLLINKIE